MANSQSISGLFDSPLPWVAIALVGGVVAFSMMYPAAATSVGSAIDSFLASQLNSLSSAFGIEAGTSPQSAFHSNEILSNVDPEGFEACVLAEGTTHAHANGVVACQPAAP